MIEKTVKIHCIATDGLPDMKALCGRVAFIFDGCVVSGWPLDSAEHAALYAKVMASEDRGGANLTDAERTEAKRQLWEGNDDVAHNRPFAGVTHWIEFPVEIWNLNK